MKIGELTAWFWRSDLELFENFHNYRIQNVDVTILDFQRNSNCTCCAKVCSLL